MPPPPLPPRPASASRACAGQPLLTQEPAARAAACVPCCRWTVSLCSVTGGSVQLLHSQSQWCEQLRVSPAAGACWSWEGAGARP